MVRRWKSEAGARYEAETFADLPHQVRVDAVVVADGVVAEAPQVVARHALHVFELRPHLGAVVFAVIIVAHRRMQRGEAVVDNGVLGLHRIGQHVAINQTALPPMWSWCA